MSTDADTMARIGRLEQLVENLYAHLGISEPARASGLSDGVRQAALSGNLIEAIRLHREETGKDLATAKAEVESML